MSREDIHRQWAPADGIWSPWVKPVLFAHLEPDAPRRSQAPPPDWVRRLAEPLARPPGEPPAGHPYRGDGRVRDTALVIDLPGETGVWAGLAAADLGFRPIPLYNAVPSISGLVDLSRIMRALVDGAALVGELAHDAAPAFLLDSMRGTNVAQSPSQRSSLHFDNRSVCHASDFPSAERMQQAGIRRAVLVQEQRGRPAPDLELVLVEWQERGIALWEKYTAETTPAAPFVLRPRGVWRQVADIFARPLLERRSDGSYGKLVTGVAWPKGWGRGG